MLPRSIPSSIAVVATAALLLAACGDDRATTPQPPTEEEATEAAEGEEDPPAFEEDEPEVEEPVTEEGSAHEEPPDDGSAEDASIEPEETPVTDEEERASGGTSGGTVAPGLEAEVEFAIQDTIDETGLSRGSIEVQLAERITWNDGSLGCPQPGEMYTQALVEGYRILLDADGRERAYHGRDGDDPFHCSDPQPVNGEGSGGTVDR